MDNLHSSEPTSKILHRQYTFGQKQVLAAMVTVILLISIIWIWKNVQIKTMKNENKSSQEALIQGSKQRLEEANQYFLKVIAKPYVWAIRKEMMQGNLEQLNLYGNDIVKEKNFLSVLVADPKGIILTSTDKKYEGKLLSAVLQNVSLSADSTIVRKVNDSLLVLTSPVMSFNSKIGTLVVNYSLTRPH